MATESWNSLRDGDEPGGSVWELYHENSKIGRFDTRRAEEAVATQMVRLSEALNFPGFEHISLPAWSPSSLSMSVGEALQRRRSIREARDGTISIQDVSSILKAAYGITREPDLTIPRSRRSVPSAGALYPLELFVSIRNVDSLPPGLYHYNAVRHDLTQLRQGSQVHKLANCLVQPDLCDSLPLFVFITAIFERSTFKYNDRGYRFSLIEAGHVAQNINLACTSLGLGALNIGGYFDREMDEFLALDGLTHSTIYVSGVSAVELVVNVGGIVDGSI